MGIDVHGNVVTINFEHERLVDTGLSNKPTVIRLDDTSVYSVFRRKAHKRRPHIAAGDGNPFIYALKSMHDITISKSEIVKLIPNFNAIIQATTELTNPEVIIPMPSSHIIADVDRNAIDSKHVNKLNVELWWLKRLLAKNNHSG